MQVFINASTSDVVATTSMEALAMGKWLICAQHPCNAFVGTFSNCLIYRSPEEFSKHLERALKEQPPPLSPSELRYPTPLVVQGWTISHACSWQYSVHLPAVNAACKGSIILVWT